jgi:hypothetical protein
MGMKMVVESMEMAPGAIPYPGRVLEQRFLSLETCLRWRRRCGTFREWRLHLLGFSHRGQYIGGRERSVNAQGAHTIAWRGQGGPTPWHGVATSWLVSVSPLDSVFMS